MEAPGERILGTAENAEIAEQRTELDRWMQWAGKEGMEAPGEEILGTAENAEVAEQDQS